MEVSCDVLWFAERDIDVWLAEELRLNAAFAGWFLKAIGQDTAIADPAYRTRVSVVEGKETDVEALFHRDDGNTFAVLVEDKIKAGFQPNQMEDYVNRGQRGQDEGRWKSFAIVVFAPAYRMPLANLPNGVVSLTFEQAAAALRSQNSKDPRASYRAQFLERAAQPKSFVAENLDVLVHEWWGAVNDMLKAKFDGFFLPQAAAKTAWVNPKCADMPAYVRLDLIGNTGEVRLAFRSFPEAVLRSIVSSINVTGIEVVKKRSWKDPTLQVVGTRGAFEVGDGLDVIADRVLAAYTAAHTLLALLKLHRALFDKAELDIRTGLAKH